MTVFQVPVFNTTSSVQCAILAEVVKLVASTSVVCLDVGGARQVVSSVPCRGFSDARAMPSGGIVTQCDGVIEMIERGTPDTAQLAALAQFTDHLETGLGLEDWRIFSCRSSDGTVDLIALVSHEPDEVIQDFLQKFWPGVRRMCVIEVQNSATHVSDDAMLWMVRSKMNASILVLDSQGHVLKTNAVGREMLARKDLLRVTPRGLLTASSQETRALRMAIAKLLHGAALEEHSSEGKQDGEENQSRAEYVLFLSKPGRAERVPMTLSLYQPESGGEPLILAMLPQPPDHKRIEELARQMGLTPSEARVAALVRSGLSNREAAERAGLKVETFNTYVKRVLSKMNVSCRAEMAQMLTWQASMERSL